MTSRQARNARRAAERREAKLARKAGLSVPPVTGEIAPATAAAPVPTISHPSAPTLDRSAPALDRAAINRANARHSTGPRTPEGKARSSRNSFKHGLYSTQLVLPGEDPAELDALRVALRSEHQPANTTEEILVNELAEHFWRLRRMREFEATALDPENLDAFFQNGTYALILRAMASAERAFHKSLATLRRFQKDRGFVPQIAAAAEEIAAPAEEIALDMEELPLSATHSGFVPANSHQIETATAEFVWQNAPDDEERPDENNFYRSEAA